MFDIYSATIVGLMDIISVIFSESQSSGWGKLDTVLTLLLASLFTLYWVVLLYCMAEGEFKLTVFIQTFLYWLLFMLLPSFVIYSFLLQVIFWVVNTLNK